MGHRILVTWEPPSRRPPYDPQFLSQFDVILTSHRSLPHPHVRHGLQGHPWFVERAYDELASLAPPSRKENSVSIITSNKTSLPGHQRRLSFALELKEELGDRAVVYGRGLREIDDKWDALYPFLISVAIENDIADDWATEKLYDCFLTWTVPFYAGCTNLHQYFPSDSFVSIQMDDVSGTAEQIRTALDDPNYFASKLPALTEARDRCLNVYNLFPVIADLVDQLRDGDDGGPVTGTVYPEFGAPSLARRVAGRVAWELRGRRQPPAGAKQRWWWEWRPDANGAPQRKEGGGI